MILEILRIPIGLFILFLPGLILSRRLAEGTIERLCIAFGLTLLIITFIGLVLSFLGYVLNINGITICSVFASIFIAALISLVRK